MQAPGNARHGEDQEHLRYEAVEKVIAQINGKRRTEDLLRMNGEDSLQRHENKHEQQQPDAQPQDICSEWEEMMLQPFQHVKPRTGTSKTIQMPFLPGATSNIGW